MSDKIIGFLMMLCSLVVIAAMFVLTILLPYLDFTEYYQYGYWTLAIVIFLAIVLAMLLVFWIGLTLLKTRAPEVIVDDEEEEQSEEKTE